jgi:hypothetical protein
MFLSEFSRVQNNYNYFKTNYILVLGYACNELKNNNSYLIMKSDLYGNPDLLVLLVKINFVCVYVCVCGTGA